MFAVRIEIDPDNLFGAHQPQPLDDIQPDAAQQQALTQSLSTLGYAWRAQGDGWLMTAQTEAKP
jgi:hypothetical protein